MTARTKNTRELLLESALNLIWTQSYGAVSVDDICKAAKAKKGSFYHYFESKSALTSAALEYLWEGYRPNLDNFFSTQNPPLERFKLYLKAAVDEQIEKKRIYGYVVGCPLTSIASEQCSCGDGVKEKANELLDRIERYFISALRDAVSEGLLPKLNTEEMAHKFLIYEMGALALARVSCDLKPLDGIFEVWMRMAGALEQDHRHAHARPG